jgi:hypothetical protein
MPTPKRYYLIRTPAHRGRPFSRHPRAPLANGSHHGNKRIAIAFAKRCARGWHDRTPVRNRRVSVYTIDPGKRPSLLFQCHADRKTGRIVSEVL